jgi:hypothetical protein
VALLYGIGLFNSGRLTDPNDVSPLGGRFVQSYIEVDYMAVPEPPAGHLLLVAVLACLVLRRW